MYVADKIYTNSHYLKVVVVNEETPGYIKPAPFRQAVKTVVSHSVADTAPKPKADEPDLYYQTSPDSPYFCVVCHKSYKGFGPLKNHLKIKHGNDLVIKCDKCDTEFKDGKALGRHKLQKMDCSKYKK